MPLEIAISYPSEGDGAKGEYSAEKYVQQEGRAAFYTPFIKHPNSLPGEMAFGELEETSNCIAQYLKEAQVVPDQIVGLCAEQSFWAMVPSMLGVSLHFHTCYLYLNALDIESRGCICLYKPQTSARENSIHDRSNKDACAYYTSKPN